MIEKVNNPGSESYSIARKFGELLRKRMENDPHFYLFSPDETTSNRLDEVYETAARAWVMKREEFDLPEAEDGRIIELLSENVLFATMIGHIMNGEQAVMTSYESFFSIILSQIAQQVKFFRQCDDVKWRAKYPAVNLLSTSTCWRQDHNGYTHQSPLTISSLLSIPGGKINCLFPVDDVAAEECFKFMMRTENVVNFTTFDKNPEPRWIDSYHAKFLFDNGGASIYRFASDEAPEIILTAAGDIVTRETLLGMKIIREDIPGIKMRFVGINALTYNAIGTSEKKFMQDQFTNYYTGEAPIISIFHGYAETLRNILSQYTSSNRITALGFSELGSTTTPMEMLTMNGVSRYNVAIELAKKCERADLIEKYQNKIQKNHESALKTGLDIIQ